MPSRLVRSAAALSVSAALVWGAAAVLGYDYDGDGANDTLRIATPQTVRGFAPL
jgi:hypothetical protein